MPRGRPKKVVKEERLATRPPIGGEGVGSSETIEIPPPNPESFSTTDISTASYLERQGCYIIGQTGSPPVFTFKTGDSEKIKFLLERRKNG